MNLIKIFNAAAVVFSTMSAGMAYASTSLPPAQYYSSQTPGIGQGYSQNTAGTFSETVLENYQTSPSTFGSTTNIDTSSISMFPNPSIIASTSLSIIIGPEGDDPTTMSDSGYYYYASVVGPTNDNVPIDLSYNESVTLTGTLGLGQAEAGASLGIFAIIPSANYDIPVIPGQDSAGFLGTKSVSGSISYLSTANTPFVVGGYVASYLGGYTGSASVILDPVLTIDPSFAAIDPNYLTDYSIELSPGVGNAASGVPEPATWAMMLMGFGVVGYAMRKRSSVRSQRLNFATV